MRRSFLILTTLCAVLGKSLSPAQAQEPIEAVWDASIGFFFDNREYKSAFSKSQTLFGLRLAPEIGLRFEERHSMMAGINFLADFGASPTLKANDYIAYYQYKSNIINCYAGLIPRSKSIGEYAYTFFSDSVYYYAPNLSGLLLQYHGKHGYVEVGLDWNSRITNTKREKFLLFLGSRIHARSLYAGLQAGMYHHGTTYLDDEVVDNILLYPHAGVNLSSVTCFDLFDVRAGWMQAFQNVRKYVGKYVYPNGLQIDLRLEKWRFGVDNTLYVGQNLMPYWVTPSLGLDYGTGLYWGEPFYRTESLYNRLELYWQPRIGERFFLRVSSVNHYDGQRWGWQQKVHFVVHLGQNRIMREGRIAN